MALRELEESGARGIVHGRLQGAAMMRSAAACAAVVFAAGIAITGLFGAAQPAAAQQGFGNYFGYQTQKRPKRRAVRRSRQPSSDQETAKKKDDKEKSEPSGPVYIVVSLGNQQISVYDRTGRIARSSISTGVRGLDTPKGVFSVIGKERHHYSNLYGGAPMPWMQRITWSGVAMHAGHVTGRPASHGCIRLPYSFAPQLYKMTKMGARVVVARNDTVPFEISHSSLPLPTMQPAPASAQQASVAPHAPAESGIELASMGTPPHVAMDTSTISGEEGGETLTPKALNPIAYAAALKARAEADKKAANEAEKAALAAAQAAGAEARQADEDVSTGANDVRNAEAGLSTAEAELSRTKAELRAAEADLEAAKAKASDLAAQAVPLPVASDADVKTTDRVEKIAADTEKAATKAEKAAADADNALAAARKKAENAVTARTAAKSELIRARAALEMASAREAVKTPAAFRAVEVWKAAVAASKAAAETLKEADRRAEPVSVFVSKKEGRVFIRQDWKEVYEAPVTIRNPDRPLGTHIYIAVEAEPDGAAMRWSAISVPPEEPRDNDRKNNKKKTSKEVPELPLAKTDMASSGPETAAGALDRIELPEEARKRISELLWTGASLIVSDHGRSYEMGEYTDFIVLTR
jgi:lipoprotein-anchoring transpeptidase ErfK/SrfK